MPCALKMILFAASLMVALAACASNGGPATPAPTGAPATVPAPPQIVPTGPITLTYWEEDNGAADVLLDELAAAFTAANPGITIQRVHYTYHDLRNQFRAESLFSGEPPDLVRSPGEFTGPFGELRIVRAMDDLFSAEYLADYLPGALDGATLRDKVWGLPDNFGGHLMLIYNRALVGQVPADTDAWIEQLKTLTDPITGQWGWCSTPRSHTGSSRGSPATAVGRSMLRISPRSTPRRWWSRSGFSMTWSTCTA